MTEPIREAGDYLPTMFVEGGCATLTHDCVPSRRHDPGGKLGGRPTRPAPTSSPAHWHRAGVDVVARRHREARRTLGLPGGSVLFDAYGGAINSIAPADTAFVQPRQAGLPAIRGAVGARRVGGDRRREPGAGSTVSTRPMRPYVSGYAYLNYIDPKLADWQHAYYGGNLDAADRASKRRPTRSGSAGLRAGHCRR